MLSINLTLPVVVAMLRRIANADPDRIGREDDGAGCTYGTIDGGVLRPICIVGQMFHDMGLLRLLMAEPSDLTYSAANGNTCSTGGHLWETLAKYGVTADEDASTFMREVQYKQDTGVAWGEAFALVVSDFRDSRNAELDREQAALDQRRSEVSNLFG